MVNVLLVYDRAAGRLLREQAFEARGDALQERFEAEEEYRGREAEIEVVVLTARSRDALLRTHGRYWLSLSQLAEAVDAAQVKPADLG